MKRNFHLLFVFIFLLLIPLLKPVNAQWEKYFTNPVLSPTSGSWDSIITRCPSVLKEGNGYKLWYMGFNGTDWGIGYATSSDGLSWNKNPQPLITKVSSGLNNSQGVVEPTVLKINNIYQMWFHEITTDGLGNRIRYATSSDGIHWTIYPNPVLEGISRTWEESGPTDPFVLYENGIFHMWYTATGLGLPWKIGYATSSDGIHWIKYPSNPLNLPAGAINGHASVLKMGWDYHIWYHSSGVIYHAISNNLTDWTCGGNCNALTTSQTGFDSQDITCPHIIEDESTLKMWYSGSNGFLWQIGLATFPLTPSYTPTPSPTPTPTPLPKKYPIIIIPGFFASWNKEAILHNVTVSQSDWSLTPFIQEYDSIVRSLKNIGYTENMDLFVFNYDWRKKISNSSQDFQNFLQSKIWDIDPNQQIKIVGHSLGGLIGRYWAQNYDSRNLNKLITVGTPHYGTAQVYKALVGGDIDKSNNTLWLAEKSILMLNRNILETDKQTINRLLPVLNDLLPTVPFLTKNGTLIPTDSMKIKNNTLKSLNLSVGLISPLLTALKGEKGNTLSGYSVINRTVLDSFLGLYEDGKPMDIHTEKGDYIINTSNAGIGNNILSFNLDHGEIMYKKEAIKKIMEELSIPYQEDKIIEGQGTNITPSLILFIQSPAKMSVTVNGNTYEEQNGLIMIENIQSNDYYLTVTGIEKGKYAIHIGQIGEKYDSWSIIQGEITKNPPQSQIDTYRLTINSSSPLPPYSTQYYFDDLLIFLSDLNTSLKNPYINYAINSIKQANNLYLKKNKPQLRSSLLLAHSYLVVVKAKINNSVDKGKISEAFDKAENLYIKTLQGYIQGINPTTIKRTVDTYRNSLNKRLTDKVISTSTIPIMIDKKIKQAEEYYQGQNYTASEIILKTVENMIKDIN